MMVGHFLLAFLVVAIVARALGFDKEKSMTLAFFAAVFATLQDVDILYAGKEIFSIYGSAPNEVVESFWTASDKMHRGLSHSLVTSFLSALGFTAYYKWPNHISGLLIAFLISIYALILNGIVSALLILVFSVVGLLVTWKAKEFLSLKEFVLVSFFGLLSHPFGDIFTGTPPDFFYPFRVSLFETRVILFSDPVVNLLSIFLLETLIALSGLIMVLRLRELRIIDSISPAVLLGIVYASAVLYIPEPTLEASYQFVFPAVIVSCLVATVIVAGRVVNGDRETVIDDFGIAAFNLVLTLLISGTAYTAAYLIL